MNKNVQKRTKNVHKHVHNLKHKLIFATAKKHIGKQ